MSAGQTHLNSDATIADEGRPQGAPLPIRYALGRAPTRGAPTDSFCPGEGAHKGRPYPIRFGLGRAPTRGAPTRFVLAWGGRPQGAPLPDSFWPGEGAHKGRPYRFVLAWGGHPQGAPLPIRFGLGRAPTRGAPTSRRCWGFSGLAAMDRLLRDFFWSVERAGGKDPKRGPRLRGPLLAESILVGGRSAGYCRSASRASVVSLSSGSSSSSSCSRRAMVVNS